MQSLEKAVASYGTTLKELPKRARQELEGALVFLVERIRENVPVKSGTLRDSIQWAIEERNGTFYGSIIAGGSQAPYALEVHEDPSRVPDGTTPEGGRGAKYITRVLDTHRERITAIGTEAFKIIFQKGV